MLFNVMHETCTVHYYMLYLKVMVTRSTVKQAYDFTKLKLANSTPVSKCLTAGGEKQNPL